MKASLPVALSLLAFAAVVTGCDRSVMVGDHEFPQGASASAVLIGTPPAPPTTPEGQPETTPVPPGNELKPSTTAAVAAAAPKQVASPGESELSKDTEHRGMPQEGQPNSHSTLAPKTELKATGVDPQQTKERKSE